MNVNFSVVGIDLEGTNVYVKFWCDGLTKDSPKTGPYTIYLDPIVETMTDQEFHEWIAKWGYNVVQRQLDALIATKNGTVKRFETLFEQEISVNLPNEPV